MALPTATCMPLLAATALTASSGSTAPGILAMATWLGWLRRVSRGWRLSGSPAVVPAAIAVPLLVIATPETASAAAAPNAGSCRQDAPLAVTKAVSAWPAWPVTTAPAWAPLTSPAVKPAGAVRVAANVQAVPFGER